jgi:hypothetical protein
MPRYSLPLLPVLSSSMTVLGVFKKWTASCRVPPRTHPRPHAPTAPRPAAPYGSFRPQPVTNRITYKMKHTAHAFVCRAFN